MITRLLKYISFGSLALMLMVLVAATLVGKVMGSAFAMERVYHSLPFVALWSLLAVSAMGYVVCRSRRATLILLHASLVTVLLGAFISFLTSKRGELFLAPGAVPASMFTTADGTLERLPFRMTLERVDTCYSGNGEYVGTYSARLLVNGGGAEYVSLSLNNPAVVDGYSFCINGISGDGLSLLVSRDIYGTSVSYIGYLMTVVSFVLLLFDRRGGFRSALRQLKHRSSSVVETSVRSSRLALYSRIVLFGVLSVAFVYRWYATGLFPVTNGAEGLLFIAWVASLLAILFGEYRRFSSLAYLALPMFVFSCVTTFVAVASGWGDTAVQPILRTPLLSVHVSTVIVAYVLLGCMALNASVALWHSFVRGNNERADRLAVVGRLLLYPAVTLLATGIFVGAFWANVSWGRYWGWDPKEVWALITLLLCAAPFHTASLRFLGTAVRFHLFTLVVFVSMLFTYFGVNYLLGGLHSYA